MLQANMNVTKFWRQRVKATILIFLLILMIPIYCEKNPNRSNSIDKRKLSSDSIDDDLTAEDYTARPQMISCGACRMREEIKSRSLEAIKGDVLRKMGFQSAPNVTGRVLPQVPPHILAMVDQGYSGMQSDEPLYKTGPSISEEEDDFHVKTEKIITFAQQYPRLRHSWRGHGILHFPFSDSISRYTVANASLFVYVKGVERRPLPSFHLDVFKVYKSLDDPDKPKKVSVASRKITQPLGRGDWVKIDITVLVSEWFKSTRDNYGLIVNGAVNGSKVVVSDLTTDGGSKHIAATLSNKMFSSYWLLLDGHSLQEINKQETRALHNLLLKAPFVEVLTTDPKRRVRRSVGLNCDDKMNEPLCCRYPLTVDFEEFGWDFIIAPKRYEAHYCSGECPYITLQRHPHTHLLKMASPNSAGPCCAPRKMSAISMLYFDQQFNVIYGSLPGMVVDRCGCS